MDIQEFRTLLQGEQTQSSSEGQKIYPLTAEILEDGERVFMETLEEELRRLGIKK